ncbi:hypothetical protein [Haloarchaeobius amylolyticus]|uniref:hypothetical protein n=1 Tax=Haloarchaeobius amylolyticus TaxID=1198296 RepID=UPI002271AFBC|nr:hypothetical protein [Haloarchaeobius amylolyticus]
MPEHDIVSVALAETTTRDDLRVSLVTILDAAASEGVDLGETLDVGEEGSLGSALPLEHVAGVRPAEAGD